MTRLSTRYAVPLLALLLVASVPVGFHTFRTERIDPCADPQALLDVSRIPDSRLVEEEKHDDEIFQRTVGMAGTGEPRLTPISFRVFRSHNRRDLIMNPTRSLPDSHQISTYPSELRTLDVDGRELPVYVRQVPSMADHRVVAYFRIVDGRPTAYPFLSLLASAPSALVKGAAPITLVSATRIGDRRRAAEVESSVLGWVRDAWTWYDAICR